MHRCSAACALSLLLCSVRVGTAASQHTRKTAVYSVHEFSASSQRTPRQCCVAARSSTLLIHSMRVGTVRARHIKFYLPTNHGESKSTRSATMPLVNVTRHFRSETNEMSSTKNITFTRLSQREVGEASGDASVASSQVREVSGNKHNSHNNFISASYETPA